MRINLRIEFADGKSKEISASAADLVAFEREFDVSISSIGQDTKFTHLLFLAWHSEKRRNETKDDFDTWIQTVEMVGGSELDPK